MNAFPSVVHSAGGVIAMIEAGGADALLKLLLAALVAQLVGGGIALVRLYFIGSRFMNVEFPAEVQKVTAQVSALQVEVHGLSGSVQQLQVNVAKLETAMQGIDRRLERVEK